MGEGEGDSVPEKLPLGERVKLGVAHTVGVCVVHTEPLSVTVTEDVKEMAVVGLSEGDTERLFEAVGPAGELEGEAVPAAAPTVALELVVSHPLNDKKGVFVVLNVPETVKLPLEEKKPLAETHCVVDRVAHWLTVRLDVLLTLVVMEAVPEEEPRAAPPEALGLPVPHSLLDSEGVVEMESEPEPERVCVSESV